MKDDNPFQNDPTINLPDIALDYDQHSDTNENPLISVLKNNLKFKGKNLLNGILIGQILERPLSERPENDTEED